MEASAAASSQVNFGRNDMRFCCYSQNRCSSICNLKINDPSKCLDWPSKSAVGLTIRASVNPKYTAAAAAVPEDASKIAKPKSISGLKLYVGLPLNAISERHTVNRQRAMAAGLKVLKLLGVNGVELPIWWGIVEKNSIGNYEWNGYLAIAEMVQNLDLKLHVSLCFHSCEEHEIPLPDWVSQVGEMDPSIYYTDRSGQHYKGCLSLAVNDLPLFNGKTAVEIYKAFFDNFKSSFSCFIGSTITGISIGLGPDGELRYPSHRLSGYDNSNLGAGEFQCYDKYMILNLKHYAENQGSPLWGLGGPHDAPSYDDNPLSSGFFNENGGSWDSPYGDFFLNWYSKLLISHGDRILSLAASTFKDSPVFISAKVPIIHSWYKSCSHPAELMAGFYNTDKRDGYKAIAEIFSKNSCKMILPGLDLSDSNQPLESRSIPELLLEQIRFSCRQYGVEVSGQNLLQSGATRSFEQIKKLFVDQQGKLVLFTTPRMGAYFFSPKHFSLFTQFIRDLHQSIRSSDFLQVEEEETAGPASPFNI